MSNGLFTVALDFRVESALRRATLLAANCGEHERLGNFFHPASPAAADPVPLQHLCNHRAGSVTRGSITSGELANGAVGSAQLAGGAVSGTNIVGGQVVKSLNGLTDNVTIIAGNNVTLNTVGNSLQISAASGAAFLTNVALLNLASTASQATAVPVIDYGFLVDATVTGYGSGYAVAPTVTVNDATGLGAVVTAMVANGEVVGLTVQDAGFGYSTSAALTIAPPPNNASQSFSGANIFTGVNLMTNANNSFAGSFTGNGAGFDQYVTAATLATPPGMVLIPAGSFTMGDNLDGESDAVPTNIYVSQFFMDINLVTLSQWQSVYFWATNHGYAFDTNLNSLAVEAPDGVGKAPNNPLGFVDWYDCVKWSNARAQQAGLTPVYYTNAMLTAVYTNGAGIGMERRMVNRRQIIPPERVRDRACVCYAAAIRTAPRYTCGAPIAPNSPRPTPTPPSGSAV